MILFDFYKKKNITVSLCLIYNDNLFSEQDVWNFQAYYKKSLILKIEYRDSKNKNYMLISKCL